MCHLLSQIVFLFKTLKIILSKLSWKPSKTHNKMCFHLQLEGKNKNNIADLPSFLSPHRWSYENVPILPFCDTLGGDLVNANRRTEVFLMALQMLNDSWCSLLGLCWPGGSCGADTACRCQVWLAPCFYKFFN